MEMTLGRKRFLNVRFLKRQILGNEIGNQLTKGYGNFKY